MTCPEKKTLLDGVFINSALVAIKVIKIRWTLKKKNAILVIVFFYAAFNLENYVVWLKATVNSSNQFSELNYAKNVSILHQNHMCLFKERKSRPVNYFTLHCRKAMLQYFWIWSKHLSRKSDLPINKQTHYKLYLQCLLVWAIVYHIVYLTSKISSCMFQYFKDEWFVSCFAASFCRECLLGENSAFA